MLTLMPPPGPGNDKKGKLKMARLSQMRISKNDDKRDDTLAS